MLLFLGGCSVEKNGEDDNESALCAAISFSICGQIGEIRIHSENTCPAWVQRMVLLKQKGLCC